MKRNIKILFATGLSIILTVSSFGQSVKAKSSEKVTVSSQAQLEKALKNDQLKKLTIKTTKEIDFKINEGTYSELKLKIVAPNATVTNKAVFKKIAIYKLTKFTEEAAGNIFYIKDDKLTFKVGSEGDISKLTVLKDASKVKLADYGRIKSLNIYGDSDIINISKNGSIDKLSIYSKAQININSKLNNKPSVVIKSAAQGTEIRTVSPVDVKAAASAGITLNEGAEDTSILLANEKAEINLTNKTAAEVIIVNPNGVKTEDTSADSENDAASDNDAASENDVASDNDSVNREEAEETQYPGNDTEDISEEIPSGNITNNYLRTETDFVTEGTTSYRITSTYDDKNRLTREEKRNIESGIVTVLNTFEYSIFGEKITKINNNEDGSIKDKRVEKYDMLGRPLSMEYYIGGDRLVSSCEYKYLDNNTVEEKSINYDSMGNRSVSEKKYTYSGFLSEVTLDKVLSEETVCYKAGSDTILYEYSMYLDESTGHVFSQSTEYSGDYKSIVISETSEDHLSVYRSKEIEYDGEYIKRIEDHICEDTSDPDDYIVREIVNDEDTQYNTIDLSIETKYIDDIPVSYESTAYDYDENLNRICSYNEQYIYVEDALDPTVRHERLLKTVETNIEIEYLQHDNVKTTTTTTVDYDTTNAECNKLQKTVEEVDTLGENGSERKLSKKEYFYVNSQSGSEYCWILSEETFKYSEDVTWNMVKSTLREYEYFEEENRFKRTTTVHDYLTGTETSDTYEDVILG